MNTLTHLFKQNVKRRANETNDSRRILANAFQGISGAAAVNLPTVGNMARNVRRQRQNGQNEHPNPEERADIPAVLP